MAASTVLAAKVSRTQDIASFVATITLARERLPSPCGFQNGMALSSCLEPWLQDFSSAFPFGAAIDVVICELPKRTGTDLSGANPIQELRSRLSSQSGVI